MPLCAAKPSTSTSPTSPIINQSGTCRRRTRGDCTVRVHAGHSGVGNSRQGKRAEIKYALCNPMVIEISKKKGFPCGRPQSRGVQQRTSFRCLYDPQTFPMKQAELRQATEEATSLDVDPCTYLKKVPFKEHKELRPRSFRTSGSRLRVYAQCARLWLVLHQWCRGAKE